MIEISKLNKYYKVGKGKMHALKDIDLTIKDGESLAIQGKSGAGKSTLMHIMGLLDSYDSGSLKIDGQEIKGLSDGKLATAIKKLVLLCRISRFLTIKVLL